MVRKIVPIVTDSGNQRRGVEAGKLKGDRSCRIGLQGENDHVVHQPLAGDCVVAVGDVLGDVDHPPTVSALSPSLWTVAAATPNRGRLPNTRRAFRDLDDRVIVPACSPRREPCPRCCVLARVDAFPPGLSFSDPSTNRALNKFLGRTLSRNRDTVGSPRHRLVTRRECQVGITRFNADFFGDQLVERDRVLEPGQSRAAWQRSATSTPRHDRCFLAARDATGPT